MASMSTGKSTYRALILTYLTDNNRQLLLPESPFPTTTPRVHYYRL